MPWVEIESRTTQRASKVKLSLTMGRGKDGRMQLSVPSSMGGELGLDKPDFVDLLMGTGDEAGQVWVRPSEKAGFKIGRLKHAYTIRFPVPAGVTLKENEALLDPATMPAGFTVVLPVWARPGEYAVKTETGEISADRDKPGSLEINGSELVMGAKRVVLTKSQAVIVKLLADNFGKVVRRQQMLDALYSTDPNGGADDKIVDVYISKIRARFEETKVPLVIVTHTKTGWELRRPVAG